MSFLMIIYDLLADKQNNEISVTPSNLFIFVMQILLLLKGCSIKKNGAKRAALIHVTNTPLAVHLKLS